MRGTVHTRPGVDSVIGHFGQARRSGRRDEARVASGPCRRCRPMIPDETLRRMVDELTDVRGVARRRARRQSRARRRAADVRRRPRRLLRGCARHRRAEHVSRAGGRGATSRWGSPARGARGSTPVAGSRSTAPPSTGSCATSIALQRRRIERIGVSSPSTLQAGHPLGFLDVSYAGELATGVVLADPSGSARVPADGRDGIPPSPCATRWSARSGRPTSCSARPGKGAQRADTTYVSLALARALLLCAHALHADAGRWVTNEKGLVPAVATLPRGAGRLLAGRRAGPGRAGRDRGVPRGDDRGRDPAGRRDPGRARRALTTSARHRCRSTDSSARWSVGGRYAEGSFVSLLE